MEDSIRGESKNEAQQFKQLFINMQRMMEVLYNDNQKKREEESFSKDSKSKKGKGVDNGKEPLEPPSSPSSSSTIFNYEHIFH